jgi:hypothetical protein
LWPNFFRCRHRSFSTFFLSLAAAPVHPVRHAPVALYFPCAFLPGHRTRDGNTARRTWAIVGQHVGILLESITHHLHGSAHARPSVCAAVLIRSYAFPPICTTFFSWRCTKSILAAICPQNPSLLLLESKIFFFCHVKVHNFLRSISLLPLHVNSSPYIFSSSKSCVSTSKI